MAKNTTRHVPTLVMWGYLMIMIEGGKTDPAWQVTGWGVKTHGQKSAYSTSPPSNINFNFTNSQRSQGAIVELSAIMHWPRGSFCAVLNVIVSNAG